MAYENRLRRTSRVQELEPLTDWIPEQYLPGIRNGTSSVDLGPYVNNAITDITTGSDSPMRGLWVPHGTYSHSTEILLQDILNGFVMLGPGAFGQTTDTATFKALSNSLSTTWPATNAQMRVLNCAQVWLQGFTLDRNNTLGDCLHYSRNANGGGLKNLGFLNCGGIRRKSVTSVNTSTNRITPQSGGKNWVSVTEGKRIELWVGHEAGDALPTGLSLGVGYLARSFVGSSFGLSLASDGPSGPIIDLVDGGTGRWGFLVNVYTIESFAGVADTITVAGAGFSNGMHVLGFNPDYIGVSAAVPAWLNRISTRHVANVSGDTFQLYDAQNDALMDLTAYTLSTYDPKIAVYYCGIRGGQNQFDKWEGLYFENCQMIGDITEQNCPMTGSPYYGTDRQPGAITFVALGCGGLKIGGDTTMQGTATGEVLPPAEGWIRTVSPTTRLTIRDFRHEAGDSVYPYLGIVVDSPARIDNVTLYGKTLNEVGSYGIAYLGMSVPQHTNCSISSVENEFVCFASWAQLASSDQGSTYISPIGTAGHPDRTLAAIALGNEFHTGTDQLAGLVPRFKFGTEFLGGVIFEPRLHGNITALELGHGNVRQINADALHTIDEITVRGDAAWTTGGYGWLGVVYAGPDNPYTTLSATVFATLSGADYLLSPGEGFVVAVDADKQGRLFQPLGSVVAKFDSGNRTTSLGATALFSGNPVAGLYEASGELEIVEADATGTVTVQLAWNDGNARTRNVVDAASTSATSVFPFTTTLRLSGSSNPTIALTVAGVTGSATFRGRAAVRRIQ